MKRGFSLVEILIVMSIIGILAALVIPVFQDHSLKAKEAAAKDNLRIFRNAIELYAAQHNNVPPGYENNNPSGIINELYVRDQLTISGNYMHGMPDNPFNGKWAIRTFGNLESLPAAPHAADADIYGWYYKPATKTLKINKSGTDSSGASYYDTY